MCSLLTEIFDIDSFWFEIVETLASVKLCKDLLLLSGLTGLLPLLGEFLHEQTVRKFPFFKNVSHACRHHCRSERILSRSLSLSLSIYLSIYLSLRQTVQRASMLPFGLSCSPPWHPGHSCIILTLLVVS